MSKPAFIFLNQRNSVVDWEDAPNWANYLAFDSERKPRWFENIPTLKYSNDRLYYFSDKGYHVEANLRASILTIWFFVFSRYNIEHDINIYEDDKCFVTAMRIAATYNFCLYKKINYPFKYDLLFEHYDEKIFAKFLINYLNEIH